MDPFKPLISSQGKDEIQIQIHNDQWNGGRLANHDDICCLHTTDTVQNVVDL